jgi:hypothetical protein
MRASLCRLRLLVASVLVSVSAACNSSSTNPASSGEVLDPTQPHYGYTDDVWATMWFTWLFQLQEPEAGTCINPLTDPTGQYCGYGQSGDVFFLPGTQGGTVVRDQCKVPAGKAILFPILNFEGDNAGVPASMQLTDSQLMTGVQSELSGVDVSSLSAEFDGVAIPNLSGFETKVTQFMYTLPPEPNYYDCIGAAGVTGQFTAYAAGFFVMLAPPTTGSHTLHFAGSDPAASPKINVDVTYDLTVVGP